MSPLDWPGLRKWSLEQADIRGTPGLKPMSEEDRIFLEKALAKAQAQIIDPEKKAREQFLSLNTETDEGVILSTLEEIWDLLTSYDELARVLIQIGGVPVLRKLAGHKNPEIQAQAMRIMGDALSNNVPLQKSMFEESAFGTCLCHMGVGDAERRLAAVAVVSRIMQGEPRAAKVLAKGTHFQEFVNLLNDPSAATKIKVCIGIRYMLEGGVFRALYDAMRSIMPSLTALWQCNPCDSYAYPLRVQALTLTDCYLRTIGNSDANQKNHLADAIESFLAKYSNYIKGVKTRDLRGHVPRNIWDEESEIPESKLLSYLRGGHDPDYEVDPLQHLVPEPADVPPHPKAPALGPAH